VDPGGGFTSGTADSEAKYETVSELKRLKIYIGYM
jgi:hypothetical protein